MPPAIVRPAAAIWRVGLPPASVWPAAALRVGGGGGKGGVHLILFRRRCRQDGRRVLGAAMWRGGFPPASVWPAVALRVGGGDKQGRQLAVTGPLPELARPAAGVSGGEGRLCVASGVCAAGGGHLAGRVAAGVGMAGGGSAC